MTDGLYNLVVTADDSESFRVQGGAAAAQAESLGSGGSCLATDLHRRRLRRTVRR